MFGGRWMHLVFSTYRSMFMVGNWSLRTRRYHESSHESSQFQKSQHKHHSMFLKLVEGSTLVGPREALVKSRAWPPAIVVTFAANRASGRFAPW